MAYHIRFCRGEDGLVEVWMKGSRVVTYKGLTAFKEGEEKTLITRSVSTETRWKEPMTILLRQLHTC